MKIGQTMMKFNEFGVAALLMAAPFLQVAAIVMDIPFADLSQLPTEKSSSWMMPSISRGTQAYGNFKLQDVSPIAWEGECFLPALFAVGEQDTFVPKHHTEAYCNCSCSSSC